ncbi:tRNA 2-selenouridine(34) synthase MnmH [Ferriphaselus sp. R-1]|uniref:tRNA 2-selenouridine(34) synthase MnmH n=1 Tax=Ferriphaselus sp. R-1 TaxID=1485544 RepID=UPI00054D64E9|nr:tRNA 2-selenouridine(34) synthase MnmH [Ferriphaselus sp. R-1]
MRKIEAATLAQLAEYDDIIDVRSPAEFAEDHIPGAISAPVLDNEERARIGTLYKQVSPFEAQRQGAALISRNIARHLETLFSDKPKHWHPLVYCWRGGQRSGAMAHILAQIGWRTGQLQGGYKTYRRQVVADLATLPAQFDFRVVCGPTGSGKSRLLQALAAAGAQVLDLEVLAQHRGSLLGSLPETPQPAQKMFESRIWDALRHHHADSPVFVEAESRKIGTLHLPEQLVSAMRSAECLSLNVPIRARIELLLEDYAHFLGDPTALLENLVHLTELHGKQTIQHWQTLAETGHWATLVEELLTRHYDPAYQRSTQSNYARLEHARQLTLDSLTPASLQTQAVLVRAET